MEGKAMSKNAIQSIIALLQEKNRLTHADAEKFIRLISDVVNEGLQHEKLVKVKGLGTFKLQAVRDRESVDVNTGERIVIEGRDKITFTPDNVLKDIVNKPFSGFDTVVIGDGVSFDEIDKKYEESLHAENIEDSVKVKDENPEGLESVQEMDLKSSIVEDYQKNDDSAKCQEKTSDKIAENDNEAKKETLVNEPISTTHTQTATEEPSLEKEEDSVDTLCRQGDYVNVKRCLYRLLWFLTVLFLLSTLVLGYLLYREKSQGMQTVVERTVISKEVPVKEKALSNSIANDSMKEVHAVIPSDKPIKDHSTVESEKKQTEVNVSHNQAKDNKESKLAEKKDEKNTIRQQESQASPYDKDPRVRYGAYRITGVEQTVTVQKGQTFSSISRAYLGPEMECYMEAVNGGKKEVKAGDKLKIPRLELKKKRNK